MKTAPKWLTALFLLAVGGVLASIGAVVGRALGPVALVAYVVLVVCLVAAGAQLVRRRLQAVAALRAARAAGRTCTCCTGTVHDPVQVV